MAGPWDDFREQETGPIRGPWEDFSPEQPPQQEKNSFIGDAVDYVSAIPGRIYDAVQGQQDPRYIDLPDFAERGRNEERPKSFNKKNLAIGLMTTFDDDALAGVLKKSLGDQFEGIERDANDYPIVRYRDDAGQIKRMYVNKPGLDVTDVARGVMSSAPYVVSSAMTGGVAPAAGLLGRMALQGAAGSGTNIAAQSISQSAGSEQPFSMTETALTGVGGAGGELIGSGVQAILRARQASRLARDNRLTPEGVEAARSANIDPEQVTSGNRATEFASDVFEAFDPKEMAIKYRTNKFDIPTTKAQRTKHPLGLMREEELRRGIAGEQARREMVNFDDMQNLAIKNAAEGRIAEQIGPNGPSRANLQDLGRSISQSANTSRGVLKDREGQIWGNVGNLEPTRQSLEILPEHITRSFGDMIPDEKITPSANQALKLLDGYMNGKPPKSTFAVLKGDGESSSMSIDTMRRRLLAIYKGAAPGADKSASRRVYDGYNKWIADAAERSLLQGDMASAGLLRSAIGFTKDINTLLKPTNRQGRQSAGARILADVMDNADSPEQVIRSLFGSGESAIKPGSVQALQRLKMLLTVADRPAGSAAVPNSGARSADWDNVRLAYWTKMIQTKQGEIKSPTMLKKSIDTALAQQKTVMDVLFDPKERIMIRGFSEALGDVIWKDPNPSGSAYTIKMMMSKPSQISTLLKNIARSNQQRSTFSKHDPKMARVWQFISQKIPLSFFRSKEGFGAKLSRAATSQQLTRNRLNQPFALPAAAGAAYGSKQ